MAENEKSLLNVVNATGFLFQLRIEKEIRESNLFKQHALEIVAREHRWIDPFGGEEFIDLILKKGIAHFVIETKRVTEGVWVFLIPDGKRSTAQAKLLWTKVSKNNTNIAQWTDFRVPPLSSESMFCIVRGQNDSNTAMLERVSSILLRSTESLANEELLRQGQSINIYCPVIITNASLQVCMFDSEKVDISSGRIEAIDQVNCPFAEKIMTILNYRPSECRHRQIGPAAPKSEFGQTSKQAGDECFGQANARR